MSFESNNNNNNNSNKCIRTYLETQIIHPTLLDDYAKIIKTLPFIYKSNGRNEKTIINLIKNIIIKQNKERNKREEPKPKKKNEKRKIITKTRREKRKNGYIICFIGYKDKKGFSVFYPKLGTLKQDINIIELEKEFKKKERLTFKKLMILYSNNIEKFLSIPSIKRFSKMIIEDKEFTCPIKMYNDTIQKYGGSLSSLEDLINLY